MIIDASHRFGLQRIRRFFLLHSYRGQFRPFQSFCQRTLPFTVKHHPIYLRCCNIFFPPATSPLIMSHFYTSHFLLRYQDRRYVKRWYQPSTHPNRIPSGMTKRLPPWNWSLNSNWRNPFGMDLYNITWRRFFLINYYLC